MADGDVLKIVNGHQAFGAPSGGGVTVTGSQGGSVAGATEFRAAGTVADLGSGVAGQGLVSSLIGPFAITSATAGLFDVGSILAELDAGTIVMAVWAEGHVLFSGAGVTTAKMEVWVGDQSDFSGSVAYATETKGFAVQENAQVVSGWPQTVNILLDPLDFIEARVIRCKQAADLYVWVNAQGGTPDSGSADIYAIIATPAS